jgi:hypothetical protein
MSCHRVWSRVGAEGHVGSMSPYGLDTTIT